MVMKRMMTWKLNYMMPFFLLIAVKSADDPGLQGTRSKSRVESARKGLVHTASRKGITEQVVLIIQRMLLGRRLTRSARSASYLGIILQLVAIFSYSIYVIVH
jgi:hypothetical protein